jgi:membrane associated rhomboid family serine protease
MHEPIGGGSRSWRSQPSRFSNKFKEFEISLKHRSTVNKINYVIIACVLASVVFWLVDPNERSARYLAFSTFNLLNGRVWTLGTAIFLHADILHLAGNMVFLFAFGNALEKEVGAEKTFLAFFAGGILSLLLGVFFYSPGVYLVGASAAIFSLTSVVLLVKPLKFSFIFFMPLGLVALIYIVYNIVAVQTGVEGNVAYISHIIGFAVGIPLGVMWSKNLVKNLFITLGLLVLYVFLIFVLNPYLLGWLGIQPLS